MPPPSPGAQSASAPSPSSLLRSAEVTLHGLSFGEHDGGIQRSSISSQVTSILHSWAVGLLLADHGRPELLATAAALSSLLRSRAAPSVDWRLLLPEDADLIAQWYWSSAAELLHHHPSHDADLDAHGTRLKNTKEYLAAARLLLTLAADAPTRRSAAANAAPGPLIFASLCLQLAPAGDRAVLQEAVDSLEQLQNMRRCDTRDELITGAFAPTLHEVLLRAEDGTRPDELRAQGVATVAQIVAKVAQCFVAHRRLVPSLPGLLDVILPLTEDVDEPSRKLSLSALEDLVSGLSTSELRTHAPRLAPCLRGALIWHDGGSGIPAARLLRIVLPLLLPGAPALADDPPREWTEGLSQLVRAAELLLDQAARAESETEKVQCVEAAVQVAQAVPDVAQGRLLKHAGKWVPVAAEVMKNATRVVGRGVVGVSVFERASDAVVEAMRWTWMLEKEYRIDVFEACMCAVLEARVCGDKENAVIRKAASRVLLYLADCAKGDAVLKLVNLMMVQTTKYRSLSNADRFFKEVRGLLTADARREARAKRKPVFVGRSVECFFPEVT